MIDIKYYEEHLDELNIEIVNHLRFELPRYAITELLRKYQEYVRTQRAEDLRKI